MAERLQDDIGYQANLARANELLDDECSPEEAARAAGVRVEDLIQPSKLPDIEPARVFLDSWDSAMLRAEARTATALDGIRAEIRKITN